MKINRLAIGFAVVIAVASPATSHASVVSYVSLGDSYTSAAEVPPLALTAPPECSQSSVNYPHLTAKALGLPLTDVSCASATTQNMTTAQYPDQPPQFNALSSSTGVVTLQIGGNDNNTFSSLIIDCTATDAVAGATNTGTPCKDKYGSTFANGITADGPVVGAAIARIHQLAPRALVFVVGYPDVLPQSGGCYPLIPLTTGDVAYANGIELDLNSMLSTQARANGATYLDTYTPSIGHDACKPESVRWVEPAVPSSVAGPFHPNAAGEAAMASTVETAMRQKGIG